MKDILKTIKTRKFLYLIIYIQLVITFYTSVYSAASIGKFINYVISIKSISNENWIKVQAANPVMASKMQNKPQEVQEWYQYISSLKAVKSSGTISVNQNVESYEARIKQDSNITIDPVNSTPIGSIDKMFLNYYDKNVVEGSPLNDKDYMKGSLSMDEYNKAIIPVLITKDLKTKYPIGTLIANRFKVMGILKPGLILISGDMYSPYLINKKFIVAPNIKLNYGDMTKDKQIVNLMTYANYIQDRYIELNDIKDFDKFKASAENKAKELGIAIKLTSRGEDINRRFQDDLKFFLPDISVSIILIVLSILGNTAVFLSLVLRRKREFGIKLAMGSSMSQLCRSLIAEVTLIVALGLATTLGIIYVNQLVVNHNNPADRVTLIEYTGLETRLLLLFIAIFIIVAVCIAPIMKIKKLQPSNLIREV